MSKRRRGVRDSRFIRDDSRPFAASGDTDAAQFEGAAEQVEMTAGQMLRAMREAAGIDAALVASALKVAPQKIEALEAGRFDELPDLTFARGLAAAFCRAFGADPTPVLTRMPAAAPGLHATGNANQPMQGGSGVGSETPALLPRPLLWLVGALLLAALVIWFLPPQLEPATAEPEPLPVPAPATVEPEHTVPLPPALPASDAGTAEAAASVASTASAAVSAASAAASSAASAAASSAASAAASSAASTAASAAAQPASTVEPAASTPARSAAGLLALEATDTVWVEVVDASGRKRISRELAKGERVNFADAPLPLKVAIGRREAMLVTVRGTPFDLAKVSGGSVARFQVE